MGLGAAANRRGLLKIVCYVVMTADRQPKTISSMIDALEKIREDLFHLQGQLEKLERGEERLSGDEHEESKAS